MTFLLQWLILAAAVWLAAAILPGVHLRSAGAAVLVAAVFGLLNWALGWLIFVVIGVATLGIGFLLGFLTRWLVNALLLKLTAGLMDRFRIDSFGWALGAALLISIFSTLGQWLLFGHSV